MSPIKRVNTRLFLMSISSSLEQAWYRHNSGALLLLPFSWLFRGVAATRRYYHQKVAPSPSLKVPVIVVGNITVGGTGKTPLLLALVAHFKQQGYRPGVISRGYGGNASEYPLRVTTESAAAEVGDEPLLLASACPVVVDPDRYRAAQFLLEQTDCDLILSDDGLQHYRLPRDIEIVVVDGGRGFGNGHCLPAGPLREPVSRLTQADFVLINSALPNRTQPNSNDSDSSDLEPGSLNLGYLDDGIENHFQLKIEPAQFRHLVTGQQLQPQSWADSRQVHAVAGIGNPQRFSTTLEQLEFEVQLHAWPDHHDFQGDELRFDDNLPVIITAKDAVKCHGIANDKVWVLDVVAVPEPAFLNKLTDAVGRLTKSR
ncbi:MAG: tetraacyldisaccharide 4'-kinase [Porticoccus sp.]|nr:tetraacyldisaccharide 4'-kinase [Porticoccus sp.]MBQ0807401.1 tetraacyldisaccharide 4'-kinase [Porticoccus sp.]